MTGPRISVVVSGHRLAAINDDERRAARQAFAEIVLRDHSFDRRAAAILERARMLLAKRERPPVSPA